MATFPGEGEGRKTAALRRRLATTSALLEVSRTLGTSLDLADSLNRALEALARHLGMERGAIWVMDAETGQPEMEVVHGLTFQEKETGQHQIPPHLLTRLMREAEPRWIPQGASEPRAVPRGRNREPGCLAVGIQVQGRPSGVLLVDDLGRDLGLSSEEEALLLLEVAGLLGQHVGLIRMVEQQRREWQRETRTLQMELKSRYRFANIIFQSDKMREVLDAAWRVSLTKATVLLRGESGTGKELVARAIHYNSPRGDKPFVKINCAAIPETLIESELFGHEKGAFTGATYEKKGRFELAHEGTLFLDEIGDIPLTTQVKLLRVLQEKQFERVGGTRTIQVDVRIIAATHRPLEEAIREGTFREDLYYRLNVVPIVIPPLRERKEDIPLLVGHFLQLFNEENNRNVKISNEALDTLLMYDWPGNVRELENTMERMIVLARDDLIMVEDIPQHIIDRVFPGARAEESPGVPPRESLARTVEDLERERILDALRRAGGVQARAARLLGITPRQIGYRIRKYRIDLSRFGS